MTEQSQSIRLAGSERRRHVSSRLIGSVPLDESVSVLLLVRPRPGSAPLPDLDYWQSTPFNKRRFLSAEEYTQAHGASQLDLDVVHDFVDAHGMTVLESHAGRRHVTIQGTAKQINTAFGIVLNRYESPLPPGKRRTANTDEHDVGETIQTHIHRGFNGSVYLPREISDVVTGVVGLDNRRLGGPAGDPQNTDYGLTAAGVAQLYNFPNPSAGVPDQTIGIIAPQPIDAPQTGANYLQSDIDAYFKGMPSGYQNSPKIKDVDLTVGGVQYQNSINGTYVKNPPNPLNTNDPYNWVYEITQDICTAATIAQGATVNVYFTEMSELGYAVCLGRVLLPAVGMGAERQSTVVSCSFYFTGVDDPTSSNSTFTGDFGSVTDISSNAYIISNVFQELATRGISVFVCSGDYGSGGGWDDGSTHIWYPSSDPWITSCGGTMVGATSPNGPPLLSLEQSWNDGSGASGGGMSKNFPTPPYQTAAGITQIKSQNPVSPYTGNRFVPDIAGIVLLNGFYVNSVSYNFIGTSCVAPLYAGLLAVLQSSFGFSLGFLNPTLYQLGKYGNPNIFNDITVGNNDPSGLGFVSNPPYFSAAPSWDPCTGWGSINGLNLLNGIAQQVFRQNMYFLIDKNTYGLDEVTQVQSWPNAFWVVLEGFTPFTVGQIVPTVHSFSKYVTVTVGNPVPEIKSQEYTPQRILYPCSLQFTGSWQTLFPAANSPPNTQILTASIPSGLDQPFYCQTALEFLSGEDPFFLNVNPTENNYYAFSQDLRVFTVTPGLGAPQLGDPNAPQLQPADNTSIHTAAAFSYITNLLNYLNNPQSPYIVATDPTDSTAPDPLDALLPDQSNALDADSSVTPTTIDPDNLTTNYINYNFAIARVRLNGTPGKQTNGNVRVFFRLFVTQYFDTDYDPYTYYTSNPAASTGLPPHSPTPGTDGSSIITIPFFATGNYEYNPTDGNPNNDYPPTGTGLNEFPITIGDNGATWAYFGCFLNLYDKANTVNGFSVPSQLIGNHHCLVAQIAYDDAPIPNPTSTSMSLGPQNCDKLAQRNLQVTLSDNPGPASAHIIPQTFDTRPSKPISGEPNTLLGYSDEMMIDWGNVPVGSRATIYWPQVDSSNVLTLANEIYSTHQLSALDAHTIQCSVPNGITYVPIPRGTGQNLAGLFTIELPIGVSRGQQFNVIVRRIVGQMGTLRRDLRMNAIIPSRGEVNWRYITGTFVVQIPVTTRSVMLSPEEETLAIMRWRLERMSPNNRWYPVLLRYISYIAQRIGGLGGNPGSIAASPPWIPILVPPVGGRKRQEFTGKVCGLIYDRFGDFDGFLLETKKGEEKRFKSREKGIESLLRFAWEKRATISVFDESSAPQWPMEIILRSFPHH